MIIKVDVDPILECLNAVLVSATLANNKEWYKRLQLLHAELVDNRAEQHQVNLFEARVQALIDAEQYDLAQIEIQKMEAEMGIFPELVGLQTQIDMIEFWADELSSN